MYNFISGLEIKKKLYVKACNWDESSILDQFMTNGVPISSKLIRVCLVLFLNSRIL